MCGRRPDSASITEYDLADSRQAERGKPSQIGSAIGKRRVDQDAVIRLKPPDRVTLPVRSRTSDRRH